MPELPEVETIVRDLNRKIKGKTIKSVQVKVPKLVKLPYTKFVQALGGQKIGRVSRRAKVILMEIGREKVLLIHLKLTGQLIFREKNGKITAGGHPTPKGLENLPNKFTHIIFTFTNGSHLFYNDLRKFGWMNLVPASDADKLFDQEYGIEPLSPEFTLDRFKEVLRKRSLPPDLSPEARREKGEARAKVGPVKKLLLDQKTIAGLGNIYADESCFYAKIKPTRKVSTLKPAEIKKLYQGIKSILKSAIKHRGTSVNTYVDASGCQGSYMSRLKVYGRAGEKCKRSGCTGIIKKIKFNGRGTHYCEECQR